MSKVFCCKDLGIECNWESTAETKEELLEIVAEHAKTEHNMMEINEAIRIKILGTMRDQE
jgi:predicted small metal-binding protein